MIPAAAPRVQSLDGLRGLAALIVVVHHALLTSVVLSTPSLSSGPRWASWLTFSPLHLFWAGPEAVLVFFVLSGFVLVLPFVSGRAMAWRAYYPSRLVRLYLPVFGAIVFALLTVVLAPRDSAVPMSSWTLVHNERLTAAYVASDLPLITGVNSLDTPLWTLQWEVIFSLLLPLFVLGAARTRRVWPWALAVLLLLTYVGHHLDNKALIYLPVFGVGAVLAANRHAVGRLTARLSKPAWIAASVVASLFLLADWSPVGHRSNLLPVVGAGLVVVVFLEWPAAQRFGQSRPLQVVGRWSFSLYLTHEPIVVTTALLLRTTNAALVLAISLPLSLIVAAAFFGVVERPAHVLSQRIRAALAQQASAATVPPLPPTVAGPAGESARTR